MLSNEGSWWPYEMIISPGDSRIKEYYLIKIVDDHMRRLSKGNSWHEQCYLLKVVNDYMRWLFTKIYI